MKYLNTYKLFENNENLKNDIINTINDILLDLKDINYNISIETLEKPIRKILSRYVELIMKLVYSFDPENIIIIKIENLKIIDNRPPIRLKMDQKEISITLDSLEKYMEDMGYKLVKHGSIDEIIQIYFK